MSNDKQLLEQALEALEGADVVDVDMVKAITAIRERLKQPEEKYTYGTPLLDAFTTPPAQPAPPECQTEAEKTAFAFGWWKALESVRQPAPVQEPDKDYLGKAYRLASELRNHLSIAPAAQRQWVCLTDELIDSVVKAHWPEGPGLWGIRPFVRDIEAKLREKNNG